MKPIINILRLALRHYKAGMRGKQCREGPEAMKHGTLIFPLVAQDSYVSQRLCPPDFLRAERKKG